MTVYFTSDSHFGHDAIRRHCTRPFVSCHEMNKTLTENWNTVIKPQDIVYHLGDFSWGDQHLYRRKLNGSIVLVKGNHDHKVCKDCFSSVHDLLVLRDLCDVPIILMHYALRVWPHSHYNSIHLFGHSHHNLGSWGRSFDVGVDAWNYRPISLDEVLAHAATLGNNRDLVDPVDPDDCAADPVLAT